MISFLIWLFGFIPNFVIYGALIFSVILLLGYRFIVANFLIKTYIKFVAIGMFIISLYASGMIIVIDEYKTRVKEFETQLAVAEEKSKQINTQIKYVYLDKKVKVQDKSKRIQENIESQKDSINKSCILTPSIIDLHNQGVRREK
jgi:hypothetical protein